jgi:hypothetical protein
MQQCSMNSKSLRPRTQANAWSAYCYGLALGVLCLSAGVAHAQACMENASCQPSFNLNGYDKGAKTVINNCATNTSSSPCAWADVAEGMQNFLACRLETTGPIALCYYSGVPGSPLFTPSCTFSQAKNAAECDCYRISADVPRGATYSYVLISAILNKKVYEDTVAQCGDGSLCLNASNVTSAPNMQEAPVCDALRNKTLFPGADVISDFSPILFGQIGVTSFECPKQGDTNLYAGCMTAPCKNTGKTDPTTGLPIVKCTCPTYDGPNQVGNPQIKAGGFSCSPTPHVWSSAFSPADDPESVLPTVP